MDNSNERSEKEKVKRTEKVKVEAIDAFAKLTGCPTNLITKVDTVSDIRARAGLPKEEFSNECYVCKRSDVKLFKCGRCKCPTELWCGIDCQRIDAKRHKGVCFTIGNIDLGYDSAISQSLIDKLLELRTSPDGDIPQELKDEFIKAADLDMKKFLPKLNSKGQNDVDKKR